LLKRKFQIFDTLLQADSDIEHCSIVTGVKGNIFPNDLEKVAEWYALLRRNGKSIEEEIRSSDVICGELYVPMLLACGLDANYTFPRDPRTLTFLILRRIKLYSRGYHARSIRSRDLVDLLSAGADVYAIIWIETEGLIWETFPKSQIATPTLYAIHYGIGEYWKGALREAGFDPAEVYAEDARRRREFRRLNGATASEVECKEQCIEESSLRLRRGRVYEDDGSDEL
jgi:hypothetical protein